MLIFKTAEGIKAYLSQKRDEGKKIGFAPTMGALHRGHLSLFEKALSENDVCVSSIFVNPAQFNDKKDLERYPRTFESDLEKLIASGCHVLFYPEVDEIYPAGLDLSMKIDFGYLLQTMEAVFRKGHFEGVAQVVKRLLDIVQPHHLYMGQKDYQQLLVVKRMIEALHLPVNLTMCTTVREADGLAMSSRNALLSKEAREAAAAIPKVLFAAKEKINGNISFSDLQSQSMEALNHHKLVNTEYFEIADAETLMPVKNSTAKNKIVICAAVKVGVVRLIDNTLIA